MDNQPPVTILMAAYNGERYINDQLKSIIAQDYENWELYIRDDNSTDNTVDIIKQYGEADSRIRLLTYGDEHGSAVKNFTQLVNWAVENEKTYLMFSDQDDIWLPGKITGTLESMLNAEKEYGADIPLLIYGRFSYIDSQNNPIDKGFIFQRHTTINNLLADNYVYGCTTMVNLSLAKAASPISTTTVTHDYWLAMVAACFGKVIFLDKALLQYRQHNSNVSGNVEKTRFSSRFKRYLGDKNVLFPVFKSNIIMFRAFYETYKNRLSTSQKGLFAGYFLNLKAGDTAFIRYLLKNKIYKAGFVRAFTFVFIISRLRKALAEATA
jgi:rhamnosyltransferase